MYTQSGRMPSVTVAVICTSPTSLVTFTVSPFAMPRVAAGLRMNPQRIFRVNLVQPLIVLRGELRVLTHLAREQVESDRTAGTGGSCHVGTAG